MLDLEEKAQEKAKSNIVDFTHFKTKKTTLKELPRSRSPLYVSPSSERAEGDDFGDRLVRVKTSLDRINKLLDELKKLNRSVERSQKS